MKMSTENRERIMQKKNDILPFTNSFSNAKYMKMITSFLVLLPLFLLFCVVFVDNDDEKMLEKTNHNFSA